MPCRGLHGAALACTEDGPAAPIRSRGRVVFLVLAIYVTAQAASMLWGREAPDESLVRIALAVASLVIMPIVS